LPDRNAQVLALVRRAPAVPTGFDDQYLHPGAVAETQRRHLERSGEPITTTLTATENTSNMLKPRTLTWPVALVGLALPVALLNNVVRVQPAVDDFGAPLTEIFRGNTDGWRALLSTAGQSTRFRPLQSLMIWAAGQMPIGDVPFRVHLLGVAWMAIYALTF